MKSNPVLSGFRSESNLSWRRFSELYTDIGRFVSAPSSETLFNGINVREFKSEIRELINEIVYRGHFASGTGAAWIIGQHKVESNFEELVEYLTRLIEYVIYQVKEQISAMDIGPELQRDKVGQWLMNENGANWDHFGVTPRTTPRLVADSEDSTVVVESQGHGSTTIADTVIGQGHESDCDSEETVKAGKQ